MNVQASLSARKDGESSFHHCGSDASLCVGSTLQRRFHCRGVAVKHVQACLSARKDGERSFLHCGIPVKLLQTCLCAVNTLKSRLNAEGVL